jgi:hypothetical protein
MNQYDSLRNHLLLSLTEDHHLGLRYYHLIINLSAPCPKYRVF